MTSTTLPSRIRAIVLTALVCTGLSVPLAQAGQSLEPLLDTSPVKTATEDSAPRKPSFVLQGSVTTIQEAIAEETSIDWYRWYLGAREYLFRTGGIPCALGTDIKFHKNGRIEPMSRESNCNQALAWRHYPLPKDTQLEAVILPVRPSEAPPASRDEVYSRVKP